MFFNNLLETTIDQALHFNLGVWRYKTGVTPMSTPTEVVAALAAYFVIISALVALMKLKREAFQLKYLFAVHNLVLTVISLVLLVALWENILPKFFRGGLHWAVCATELFTSDNLQFFYYVNYLIKYVELLDTVFLILKKKPLTFLHVFHHSMTALLCFTQLDGKTTVQWVPITLNLFVHVLMYYYYFMSALGVSIWWKKYLTSMQITQFVIDIIACYYYLYQNLQGSTTECTGGLQAAYFGCFLLTSYLFLFIQFFQKTYGGKKTVKKELKAE